MEFLMGVRCACILGVIKGFTLAVISLPPCFDWADWNDTICVLSVIIVW